MKNIYTITSIFITVALFSFVFNGMHPDQTESTSTIAVEHNIHKTTNEILQLPDASLHPVKTPSSEGAAVLEPSSPAGMPSGHSVNTNSKNTKTAYFTSNMPVDISLRSFRLQGPAGAINTPMNISVTGLEKSGVRAMDPGLTNVTGEFSGYRLLPDHSTFNKYLVIAIPYDSAQIPKGYSPKEIRSFFYDEQKQQWVQLPVDSVDTENAIVYSFTDHFTDFINGVIKVPESPTTNAYTPTKFKDLKAANPLAGYNSISPPSANNKGTANLSFPIEIPQGRNGMQPNLAITYNSGGGNGWLGVGWNLQLPSIDVETRWGVPRYSQNLETESYLINGEQLTPMVHRSKFSNRVNGPVGFDRRVEGRFDTIIRHGDKPDEYWWEVTDRSGVTYYYGKYSTDANVNPACVLTDDDGNIARWALAEVRDLHGNYVKYVYQKKYHTGFSSGTVTGKQIYPSEILYTGHGTNDGKYRVEFELDNTGIRNDVIINARKGFKEVTANLLDTIKVSFNGEFIRQYKLLYNSGGNKSLLCKIVEINDNEVFKDPSTMNFLQGIDCEPTGEKYPGVRVHRFDYFQEVGTGFSTSVQLQNIDKDSINFPYYNKQEYALGKSKNSGYTVGGSLNVGYNDSKITSKSNSVGGSFNHSNTKSETNVIHLDIDGDGLPDRLEREGSDVKYYKLDTNYQYDSNGMILQGLSDLGKSLSFSNTWGLEGHLGIGEDGGSGSLSGSYSSTRSTTLTSSYFADVNGDGYMDFINDHKVLFNMPDSNGIPHFIENNADTVYYPNESCQYIIWDESVSDSMYYEPPESGFQELYQRDVVRMWVAPFDGYININSNIQLLEDTSWTRINSNRADGITYTIQLRDSELHRDTIGPNSYNTKSALLTSKQVNKGDYVFFRLLSNEHRDFDNVRWNPKIYYVDNIQDTILEDANNKTIYSYSAKEDYFIHDKQTFTAPYRGIIHVLANIQSSALSDSAHIMLVKNNNIKLQQTFTDNLPIDYNIDDTLHVDTNDTVYVYVKTNTTIDWSSLDADVLIKYLQTDSFAIDTSSASESMNVHTGVKVDLMQKVIRKTLPVSLNTGNYTFTPSVTIDSANANGQLIFTVKQQNKLLGKKTLNIVQGNLNVAKTIDVTLSNANPADVYFELHTGDADLGDDISSASVSYNGNIDPMGIHVSMNDSLWKFGNLYRGWGQFSYKDKNYNANAPIDLDALHFNRLYTDTSLMDFDTSNLSNVDTLKAKLEIGGLNSPSTTVFNSMFADYESSNWVDYARYSGVSNTRLWLTKPELPYSDSIVDFPNSIAGKPTNYKRKAINLKSRQKTTNHGWSIGASSVNLGETFTNIRFNKALRIYMDINGDRFPDPVNKPNTRVQYTNPYGGLNNQTTVNNINTSNKEGLGTSKSFSVNLPMAIDKGTQGSEKMAFNVNGGISVSNDKLGGLETESQYMLIDINGDGLPDKVKDNGEVALNLGYEFATFEQIDSSYIDIERSNSNNFSFSVGLSGKEVMKKSGYSWAVGFGKNYSDNEIVSKLSDLNGDGYPDIITNYNDSLFWRENTGTSFMPYRAWDEIPTSSVIKSKSNNSDQYGAFTLGIPVSIVKILGNFRAQHHGSETFEKSTMIDFNNDGYTDILFEDGNNGLAVKYNTMGKVNLLRKVTLPTDATYAIDYKLTTSSQKDPQRHWVMNSLSVYDAHHNDGKNTVDYAFSYHDSYYSRAERTSYGFHKVVTKQMDGAQATTNTYRTTITKYHNNDFLFKGLKYYSATLDSLGNIYVENTWNWDKKEISSGKIIPADSVQCYGPYYPAIGRKDVYYYEGQANVQLHTRKDIQHGQFGNIIHVYDHRDTAIITDDVYTDITYDNYTNLNLLGLPVLIEVRNKDSILLRKRTADYYSLTGNLKQIISYNDTIQSKTDISYDSYGNLNKITYPENHHSQRMYNRITYDTVVHTYPVRVSDARMYTSTSTYDYRIGSPLSTTDIAGQEVNYKYYNDGRLKSIQGPYEKQNGDDWLIKYEYFDRYFHDSNSPDSTAWARTTHLDPLNDNNFIHTVLFTDGLGRVIQTKKDAEVNGNVVMTISGAKILDAYGRPIKTYYPVTENLGHDSIFNYNLDAVQPTQITYDIMDRKTQVTLPDNSVNTISYGFGNDAFGNVQFKTTTTDANNISFSNFTNAMGKKTTLKAPEQTITTFKYNPLGELLESTDPDGNTTHYKYDMLGQLMDRVHPDAGKTVYTYDKAGNMRTIRTAKLASGNDFVEYGYDYNRVRKIVYPQNPENNVFYEYAPAGSKTSTGKLVKLQDASGVQTFKYGKLGELIENTHTFVMPNGEETYTFQTQWEYDSWNRIHKINYPDNEIVEYEYDDAGQLEQMNSSKGSQSFGFIEEVKYDKFGSRTYLRYANGSQTNYNYDNTLHRLEGLHSSDGNGNSMQDISYTYDNTGNITDIDNNAGIINGMGGNYNYSYQYDSLYRLIYSNGSFDNGNTYDFELSMEYSASGKINTKTLDGEKLINGNPVNVSYDHTYNYNSAQPHTIEHIYDGNEEYWYSWDANGNMTQQESHTFPGLRRLCWDEENRLSVVKEMGANEGALSSYIYNSGGERVWKITGQIEQMTINGTQEIDHAVLTDKTLYTSPYMVATDQLYTKHYYIENERIASKIGGGFADAQLHPLNDYVKLMNDSITGITDYDHFEGELWAMLERQFNCVDQYPEHVEYDGRLDNIIDLAEADDPEEQQYFYHPDHLGSSSFITDVNGDAHQHMQYLPYGEDFISQRIDWQTRYTFSAKEKDKNTGYHYFGARYYDSEVSVWLSVDPMSDEYPSMSPYMYVAGNPLLLTDYQGMYIRLTSWFKISPYYSVYQNLKKTSPTFGKYAYHFYKSKTYDWTLDYGTVSNQSAETYTRAETRPVIEEGPENSTLIGASNSTVFSIDPGYDKSLNEVAMAKTMIHEAMHADMNNKLALQNKSFGDQHEYMANNLRTDIVEGITEYVENNHITNISSKEIEILSWSGLTNTSAFKEKYDSAEKVANYFKQLKVIETKELNYE